MPFIAGYIAGAECGRLVRWTELVHGHAIILLCAFKKCDILYIAEMRTIRRQA